MRSTVSKKGIRAGDQLKPIEEAGRLVAKKAIVNDPVAAVYGILGTADRTDEMIRALRGTPTVI
jgi:hypothetical protein